MINSWPGEALAPEERRVLIRRTVLPLGATILVLSLLHITMTAHQSTRVVSRGGKHLTLDHVWRTLEENPLSVEVTFDEILRTVVFLLAAWLLSVLSRLIGLPSLVGEIVSGFILGPPLLDFCPYPEAMVLIGSFGLIGLIMDCGINLDINQLKETGTRAIMLAFMGTVLAMITGFGLGLLEVTTSYKSAVAIGAAFSPSSFGVASQVLSAGDVLNTPTGQLIVAASVVDDVLGLILLSILEVFVMETPQVIDWIKPFLASFGYLLVLGYIGITWFPRLLEKHILPLFPEEKRDTAGFAALFFLLTAYLPLLKYSGASYLTGAFLAGLSFSQINTVHAAYTRSSHEIMIWLMRIFFAATIGFQVPILMFGDAQVLGWGFLFLVPVLAKLPLGIFVPRFQRDLPDDFPYDPYWRDASIATLSMICRGEFNFIIASSALSSGLIEPHTYAAVVFAVLMSCVFVPLVLSKIIQYYNNKSNEFLRAAHPIKRIGNTCDGYRPLFLAIQARTPVHWNLQEKFTFALETAGIIIIDHRSWHTLGLDAVDITEIFCQDKTVRVKVKSCFEDSQIVNPSTLVQSVGLRDAEQGELPSLVSERVDGEHVEINKRREEIRQVLVDCLPHDTSNYNIQVLQWEAFSFEDHRTDSRSMRGSSYAFHSFIGQTLADEGDTPQAAVTNSGISSHRAPSRPFRLSRLRFNGSAVSADTAFEDPCLDGNDMWNTDSDAHMATRSVFFMSRGPEGPATVTGGCPGDIPTPDTPQHSAETVRRRSTIHRSGISPQTLQSYNEDIEADTIKGRLRGYVRP